MGFRFRWLRIGTGAAGAYPAGDSVHAAGRDDVGPRSARSSAPIFWPAAIPKSLAGGLAAALVTGLCLPVCDCMVVALPFANLMRRRLPLTVCGDVSVRGAGDESRWRYGPLVRIHRQTRNGGGPRRGLGMVVAIVGGVVRGVAARSPAVRERAADDWAIVGLRGLCRATVIRLRKHPSRLCRQPPPAGHGAWIGRFTHFIRHTYDDFMRMMPILLFGTIIASIMRTALSSLANGSSTLSMTPVPSY